jgi:hypothetical protein
MAYSLQPTISLRPPKLSPGLDYTGPGQASVTVSMVMTTDFTSPGNGSLYGKFAQRSTTSPEECTIVDNNINEYYLAGIFVDDKFAQNAPADLGTGSYVNQGDSLDVMRVGFVAVQTVGTFNVNGDLYINNSTSADYGKLQNSSTNGYLIGGPSYTKGVSPIRVESSDIENNLALVSINI